MILLSALGIGAAHAALEVKTGTLCVKVATAFSDFAGDNWIENSDRGARGFAIEIIDKNSNGSARYRDEYLDDGTGCLSGYSIRVDSAYRVIGVTVTSKGLMSGVEVESWEGDSPDSKDFETNASAVSFTSSSTFDKTVTITDSADRRWTNLLVASVVFKGHDWNIHEEPEYCTGYSVIDTPVQMQVNTYSGPTPKGCCQSRLVDGFEDASPTTYGVHVGPGTGRKFVIAHELGHVILAMRMGGGEDASGDAPEDGCENVGYTQAQTGMVTKEYTSIALKEGWADFVAAMTWNEVTEDDCEFQNHGVRNDFDFDDEVDFSDWWAAVGDYPYTTDPYRTVGGVMIEATDLLGTYDCEGNPRVDGMTPAAPALASWVSSENWLEDAEGIGTCERDPDDDVESQRTTKYDVVRMLWDLRTDQDVTGDELSDLMVNACPRDWAPEDTTAFYQFNRPFARLTVSAFNLGLATEFNAEDEHVLHP